MTIWANFLLLEKLFQKLVLRVSSGFPNTRKQSKHSACGLVRIWKPWWNTRTHFQNITSQYFFLGTIFVEVWKDLNCLLGALIFTLWKFLKKKYNISSGHVIYIILLILSFMTITSCVFSASSFISIILHYFPYSVHLFSNEKFEGRAPTKVSLRVVSTVLLIQVRRNTWLIITVRHTT